MGWFRGACEAQRERSVRGERGPVLGRPGLAPETARLV